MKNISSRREFLAFLGGTGVLFLVPDAVAAQKPSNSSPYENFGYAMADGLREVGSTNKAEALRIDAKGNILFSNFTGSKFKKFPLSFVPHQVIQNPQELTQVVAIQKWGANAVVLDVKSGEIKKLPKAETSAFYGHGLFSNDGSVLYVSTMDYKNAEGKILVYDTKKWIVQQEISTGGVSPHDLQASQDGQHFVVINYGWQPGHTLEKKQIKVLPHSVLTRVNRASGKITQQHELQHSNRGYAHFLLLDDNRYLCFGLGHGSSYPTDKTALAYVDHGKVRDLTEIPELKDFKGETLSGRKLANGQRALLTLPDNQKLLVLDLEQMQPAKVLDAPKPRSIVRIPETPYLFFSVQTPDEHLYVFSEKDNEYKRTVTLPEVKKPATVCDYAPGAHATEILWPKDV